LLSRDNVEALLGHFVPRECVMLFAKRRHCEPTGPREARPDDRLREAIQNLDTATVWIASSLRSSQ
jgi:hypothetical protein